MSAPAIPRPESLSISSSSVEELLIPFPLELQKVFNRLAAISKEQGARKHPSEEAIDWAADVLLRVVPSAYLIGAEIDPFESEIHVTWENNNSGKSVIVFFHGPPQIKMYWEWMQEGTQVREHQLLTTEDVSEVSARLRWFFQ